MVQKVLHNPVFIADNPLKALQTSRVQNFSQNFILKKYTQNWTVNAIFLFFIFSHFCTQNFIISIKITSNFHEVTPISINLNNKKKIHKMVTVFEVKWTSFNLNFEVVLAFKVSFLCGYQF